MLAFRRSAPERPFASIPPGAVVAPGYVAVRHLHRGRTTDSYEAWSSLRGCACVTKVVRGDLGDDARRMAAGALMEEGLRLWQLSHPNLVRAYDLLDDPRPVVVLEPLAGESVQRSIARRRIGLGRHDLAHLGLQLCSALQYLHANNLLHLDLKPANVVVHAGRLRIVDLAHARPPGRPRGMVGTPGFAAPEQTTCQPLGAAADVWGVGMLLYWAAALRSPLDAPGNGSDTWPRSWKGIAPLRTQRRFERSLCAAVDACLDPDPWSRPELPELASALRAHSDDARI